MLWRSSNVLLPEVGRGETELFFEDAGEVESVLIAAQLGDFGDGVGGFGKQVFGGVQADGGEAVHDGFAAPLAEEAGEVALVDFDAVGDAGEGEALAVVLADDVERLLHIVADVGLHGAFVDDTQQPEEQLLALKRPGIALVAHQEQHFLVDSDDGRVAVQGQAGLFRPDARACEEGADEPPGHAHPVDRPAVVRQGVVGLQRVVGIEDIERARADLDRGLRAAVLQIRRAAHHIAQQIGGQAKAEPVLVVVVAHAAQGDARIHRLAQGILVLRVIHEVVHCRAASRTQSSCIHYNTIATG